MVSFYRDQGFNTVPTRGALAALTVPAAVSTWMLAQEMAARHGGRIPLKELLHSAVAHARNGYTVSKSQSALTREKLSETARSKGFHETFLTAGNAPAAGTVFSGG